MTDPFLIKLGNYEIYCLIDKYIDVCKFFDSTSTDSTAILHHFLFYMNRLITLKDLNPDSSTSIELDILLKTVRTETIIWTLFQIAKKVCHDEFEQRSLSRHLIRIEKELLRFLDWRVIVFGSSVPDF